MSNVAIFMENIIAYNFTNGSLSIKDVYLVHICCSLRNTFEMHSQCKDENNIWFKKKIYGMVPTLHMFKVVLKKPNAVIKYTLSVILVELNFALLRNS